MPKYIKGGGEGNICFRKGGNKGVYILREKANLDMLPSFLSPSCLFIKVSPRLSSSYFHRGQSDTKHSFLLQLTKIEAASCLFHIFSSFLVIQRLQSICFLDTSSLVCLSSFSFALTKTLSHHIISLFQIATISWLSVTHLFSQVPTPNFHHLCKLPSRSNFLLF